MARWAKINKYGRYAVSDDGKVKNIKTNRILTQHVREYPRVTLIHDDGRISTVEVHRLVALAWVSGYFDGATVNHKDGNKTNNDYRNLEWMTQRDNMQHALRNGLIKRGGAYQCTAVSCDSGESWETQSDAARAIGCSVGSIGNVLCGRRHTVYGYRFYRI